MKITDVHLTLFGWDDIPATTYGRHTGKFSGKSQLGLVTIETDEGVKGHAFLGSYRESAPAYASSAVLPSKEAYAEEAARFKAEGWTAYKIHPPTDPVVDAEVCRAVRRAVGDGFTVMLDSTWAYQYPEALRVGKVVEELGFHWYEDPLADDDLLSYVKLKQHLSIPILATEYSPGGLTAFAPWLVHQ